MLESDSWDRNLYGITDGKAIGTYLEHKFRDFLAERFAFVLGNSAEGRVARPREISSGVPRLSRLGLGRAPLLPASPKRRGNRMSSTVEVKTPRLVAPSEVDYAARPERNALSLG